MAKQEGANAGCVRPSFLIGELSRENLLRHLAADFAARIGCGVNVDVVLAGHEVGGLRIGQRGAAFDRARCCVGDSNRDAGVLAGLGRAMEMRGGGGTRQAGIAQLPAQLLAGGIVVDVGGAGGGAGVRRAPRTCRRASPSSCRRRRGRQKQRAAPSASVASMVLFDMVFLPVDVKRRMSASKQRLSGFIPGTMPSVRNFMEAHDAKCGHTGLLDDVDR